ncbi:MAG: NADH-quinone oxidoreductase subunit L [Armatimonadota bacterium]
MERAAWLIILAPFAGVLINGLLGRRLGKRVVGIVACSAIFAAFIGAAFCFWVVASSLNPPRALQIPGYTWIPVGTLQVSFGLLLDPLSIVMALVVTGVGLLIHVYSIGYMAHDEHYARYFTWLNLFTGAMLLLVLGNSFLLLFVGWEGVALCSYLLIGFWFERKSAAAAGSKAFMVNRAGDFGFLVGLLLIFATFGSLDYWDVFINAPAVLGHGGTVVTAITLLLFIGATGKSAQIPLYVWLPDAMEGPTPVSALIHAATMVTAGVYMVARCSVLFAMAPVALIVVACVGAGTAVFAASIGLVQNDIKRVLAYSTISQLGYMFLACGVGAFAVGIFHLMTHAFFKALLFMCAGSVIHSLDGEQDIRRMGGLRGRMKVTYWSFVIGALAISGIVPLAGFCSKDKILWHALADGHPAFWAAAALAAGMTAFYMFRLVFKTFWGESRVARDVAPHVHESPAVMTVPLIGLAVLSVIGGWISIPLLEQFVKGSDLFGHFLQPTFAPAVAVLSGEAHEVHVPFAQELAMTLIALGIAALGIILAYLAYVKEPGVAAGFARALPRLYRLVVEKYRVDEAYRWLFVRPGHEAAKGMWRGMDVAVIDGAVNGVARLVGWASGLLRRLQTGYVRSYALATAIGVVAMLLYMLHS